MTVLQDLERYAARHRVTPGKVVYAVFGTPGVLVWLRRGKPVSALTLRRLSDFMAEHPEGLPARQVHHAGKRDLAAGAARVVRDPCPRCGVRADFGCEHQPRALAATH